MRIGLFGQFGSGNSGNDGSLEAMIAFLRRVRPNDEIVCICSGPAVVEERHKVSCISITAAAPEGRVFRFLNRLLLDGPRRTHTLLWAFTNARHLDVLIVPGTGILDDFCERPFGWPFVILRWCLAARLAGTKLFFVSIGAGPIRHPLSRFFMKTAAGLAAYRSYRDRLSWYFMRDIGLDVAGDRINCDLAFHLPVPENRDRNAPRPTTVGVGIMSYSGWEKDGAEGDAIYAAYLAKMVDFVVWLSKRGMAVRLLTGDISDRRAVGDLLVQLDAKLQPDSAVISEEMDSLHDLMCQIMQTDLVVTTRYHNVVCALKLSRPTISLGYADKNDELETRLGLSEFCQHVDTFDLDILKRQLDRILAERVLLQETIRRGTEVFRAQLDEQEAVLDGLLEAATRAAGARNARKPVQVLRRRSGTS